MVERMEWGRSIRAYRKLKGYTQQDFAKEIRVSVSLLGEVERGIRVPDDELIERICASLQISKSDMMRL
ncbi:transcriptional regulator with XRE-family HTH domain [Alkalihalobacillus xiaoxiensis]|uniref:Transcriptional regulator with XRE-family HTH domain n=1 Tax=Shouchella xiaoxiensis TaxID=766895 RepID=A0ABS2T0L3_9BACI|nr:helix-turn-helix transcriptional regulator [Shouchella xiaoxiensis]MBM7841309.1 transcriptional regulator with XRE-family HTH domain [Shouchella xiaoxiensis]